MNLTLSRTEDYALVKSIVTNVAIYRKCSDDFASSHEVYEPPREAVYLLARDQNEVPSGIWALVPRSHIVWEVHTCLLPRMWGVLARIGATLLLEWVWNNTACQRLVTEVPAYNRLALAFAIEAGMTEYGRNPEAYMKNGVLHDIILLGISRPGGVSCPS